MVQVIFIFLLFKMCNYSYNFLVTIHSTTTEVIQCSPNTNTPLSIKKFTDCIRNIYFLFFNSFFVIILSHF